MASLDNKPYHFDEESSKRLCEELGIEYTGPMVMSFSPELTKKLCEAVGQSDQKPTNVSIDIGKMLGRPGRIGTRYTELVDGAPLELEGDTISMKVLETEQGAYLSHTEGRALETRAEDLVPTPVLFDSPLDERFVVDQEDLIADQGLKVQNAGYSGVYAQQQQRLNLDDTSDVRITMFNDEELDEAVKLMNDFSKAVSPPYIRGFKLKKEPLANDPVDPVNVHAMVEHAIRTLAPGALIMTCGEAANRLGTKEGVDDHFYFIALERSITSMLEWFSDLIETQPLIDSQVAKVGPHFNVENWRRAALQISKGITFYAVAPGGFETYSDIFKLINSLVAANPDFTGLVFVFSD